MTATRPPSPLPVPDAVSTAFWDLARTGVFAVARCTSCRAWQHPPQERCRHCDGELHLERASGNGTIYSFTVVRHQMVTGFDLPYVVGLIELDEQPRLRMSAIVVGPIERVSIGGRVAARMVQLGDSDIVAAQFELVCP